MNRKFLILFILLSNFSLAYAQRMGSEGGLGTGGKGGNGTIEDIISYIRSSDYIFNLDSCSDVRNSQKSALKRLCEELDIMSMFNTITPDQELFRLDCCLHNQ